MNNIRVPHNLATRDRDRIVGKIAVSLGRDGMHYAFSVYGQIHSMIFDGTDIFSGTYRILNIDAL